MRSSFISLLLATVSSVVTAQQDNSFLETPHLPPDHPDSIDFATGEEILKRSPPAGVYVCDSAGWKGICKFLQVREMSCNTFSWNTDISFGVPAQWQCKFYWGDQCSGTKRSDGKLTLPGTSNFAALYGNIPPKSFKCRQCPGDPGCKNGNAPDFSEATAKLGDKSIVNGECQIYADGNVISYQC
ncbi:hypothetical protein PV08_01707 [Exophiala spinifera]|uniref:Cyanovirin-N domain-containing protein n=1 Tax=Exophiala spinifera TaxID=91928 RepID=A0A0D2A8M8_9EURO|nr:uncharacterized protein PV08_01707 [Exophiala spinifera]KIW21127.1 hypothetical protein PV08_01707 [Exophiala spinifera]